MKGKDRIGVVLNPGTSLTGGGAERPLKESFVPYPIKFPVGIGEINPGDCLTIGCGILAPTRPAVGLGYCIGDCKDRIIAICEFSERSLCFDLSSMLCSFSSAMSSSLNSFSLASIFFVWQRHQKEKFKPHSIKHAMKINQEKFFVDCKYPQISVILKSTLSGIIIHKLARAPAF